MSLKTVVITSFAKFIVGSKVFEQIKDIVLQQEDTGLKGEEKRKAALNELKTLGLGIASWALGLCVELSVAYFKTLSGEKVNV